MRESSHGCMQITMGRWCSLGVGLIAVPTGLLLRLLPEEIRQPQGQFKPIRLFWNEQRKNRYDTKVVKWISDTRGVGEDEWNVNSSLFIWTYGPFSSWFVHLLSYSFHFKKFVLELIGFWSFAGWHSTWSLKRWICCLAWHKPSYWEIY